MEQILTPWNEDQVNSLNAYQASEVGHPFTCGCRASLVATSDGWICPKGCNRGEQKWCFSWMADWSWKKDFILPGENRMWNYRVYRETGQFGDYLTIHEAYYLEGDPQIPTSFTAKPVTVGGESVEDLRWVLEQMLKALDQPILERHAKNDTSDEVK